MDSAVASRMRVCYRGRVQGVGFRATCQSLATDYPVTGFVRNEPDGSVLLEAQGTASEVECFLKRVASELAHRIEDSVREEIPLQADSSSFRVAY